MLTKRDNLLWQCHSLIVIVDQAQNISTDYHSFQQAAHINSESEAMHRIRMTALAGILALTTSGSDWGKTPFQPDLTAFFPKNPDQATNQKPEYPTGLIQSTNVEMRLKQLQQGQSDPFTRLFPTPQLETATKPEKIFPDLPKLPIKKKLPAPSVKVTRPSTKMAEGVAVEGVMQLGDKTRAIIKVPTDGVSRYVSVGQRLSSGQLLVKRIEIAPDSEPMVVLEQNGIEISKAVGEQTDESTDSIASSTRSQIGNDYEASNEQASNSETSTDQAAKAVKSTQPTEKYTAAIPVSSPPPLSSSDQKTSFDLALAPASTNSIPSTDLARSEGSVRENYPKPELLSSSSEVFDARLRTPDDLGQDQIANQPELIASANLEDSTDRKQRLIERLRSGSNPPVENKLGSNSLQTSQANVVDQAYQQQQISDGFSYKKSLARSNELSTTSPGIEVLAHRQQLINQLRQLPSPSD